MHESKTQIAWSDNMVNEISLTDRFLRYVSISSEIRREAGFAAMLGQVCARFASP